jgi:hypothetical protein
MKTIALTIALLFTAVAANAADACAPVVSTPVCEVPGATGEITVGKTVEVPGPGGTTVTYGVPVPGPGERVEWVEETYTDMEDRLETVGEELRTRVVPKKFEVVHTKTVTDTHIVKVASRTGRSQRLVRGKINREKEYTRRETLNVKEDYMHPIQEVVRHEVQKVRRVPALVTR